MEYNNSSPGVQCSGSILKELDFKSLPLKDYLNGADISMYY